VVTATKRNQRIDSLDRKIVGLLQEDARLTNEQVAARVGSTEPTIRRRLKRLLDAGLIRIVAVVSPFDLGYRIVALLGIQLDQSRLARIGSAVVSFPEVRFAGVTGGNYDILAEVWFESTEQLVSFISDRVKKIPGVERVESIQVLKLLKYAYDWGKQPSATLMPVPSLSNAESPWKKAALEVNRHSARRKSMLTPVTLPRAKRSGSHLAPRPQQ